MRAKSNPNSLLREISQLEDVLHRNRFTINPAVLESSDSESQTSGQAEQLKARKQPKGLSLEQTMLEVRSKYLEGKSKNEQWYQEQMRRLYRMYKLN